METNFDWSMMRAFHSCRRKYYYTYVMSIRPDPTVMVAQPGAMEFGSAIDAGLDFAYQIISLPPTMQEKMFHECFPTAEYRPERMHTLGLMAAGKVFAQEWGDVKNKGYTKELGYGLIDEYFHKWFPEGFDTVDSQISGPVPLGEWNGIEINLQIKADRLVWGYNPNSYSIFEVKTTAYPSDVWWQGQELSYQVDGYVMGVEAYHDVSVHSAVIDCLATKQKKDRMIRRPILITSKRRKNYEQWLFRTIDEIMSLQEETRDRHFQYRGPLHRVVKDAGHDGAKPHHIWPENRSACTSFNRVCSYASLCESDCHPGALSRFKEDLWRPYMHKE